MNFGVRDEVLDRGTVRDNDRGRMQVQLPPGFHTDLENLKFEI